MNEFDAASLEIRPGVRTDDGRWISRSRTAFLLTRDRLVYRGPLRSRNVLRGRTALRVVVVPLRFFSGRRCRMWILLTGDRRAVLALNQQAWPDTGLEEIRMRLGAARLSEIS